MEQWGQSSGVVRYENGKYIPADSGPPLGENLVSSPLILYRGGWGGTGVKLVKQKALKTLSLSPLSLLRHESFFAPLEEEVRVQNHCFHMHVMQGQAAVQSVFVCMRCRKTLLWARSWFQLSVWGIDKSNSRWGDFRLSWCSRKALIYSSVSNCSISYSAAFWSFPRHLSVSAVSTVMGPRLQRPIFF